MVPQPPLKPVEADILYLIWKRKTLGDGRPVTSKDLHKALIKERGGPDGDISAQVVKRALYSLKNRTDGLLEAVEVSRQQSGPSPTGYRLAHDKLITWPATAAIVLALYNYPEHVPPDLKGLIDFITKRGLRVSLQDEDIQQQIAACIKWNYITKDKNTGRLSTTRRVDDEFPYLTAIAGELRDENAGRDSGS